MVEDGDVFRGEVKVASRIIDYLSSGLYETPAACLKELVNNAYDADATRVDIHVLPDLDQVLITDDGTGMNREEFENHFGLIADSSKRSDSQYTAMGRPKIGRIGIRFHRRKRTVRSNRGGIDEGGEH